MKLKFSCKNHYLAVSALALFSASPAWAVFPFSWATSNPTVGNPIVITGGNWTGNGALQPGLNPASTAPQIAVQNFTSGSFLIDQLAGNYIGPSGRIQQNPSVTHTVSLLDGSADFRLHNSNSNDGGALLFNSLGLTDFQGVTEVNWTMTFSEAIAGRNTDLTGGSPLTSRPMGAGLALITAGTGQDRFSFTVDMEYTQIYQETTPNTFISGVPSGAVPRQNQGFGVTGGVGYGDAGATSFTSNAFNNIDEFLLVRGYDVNNNGIDTTDMPKIYMRQMHWKIRKDDGSAFAANTLFTFSMDGQQYSNVGSVIPEPTSLILVAGSLLGGCILRRRRA